MTEFGFKRNFPPLEILSEGDVKDIQKGILDTLENTGIRFESKKSLDILGDHGCEIDSNNNVVKFPPFLVEESLSKAPSSFRLKSRNPDDELIIGGDTVYFEGSVGMRAADPMTGERFTPTLEEDIQGVKVLDSLDNIHSLVSYCPYNEVQGVPDALRYTLNAAVRFMHSTKVARTASVSGSGQFSMKMAHLCGMDIDANVEPAPPLTFYKDAIENLFFACEIPEYQDFPIRFGDGDVMGATAPATFAGSLVTSSAEIAAGIVLTQLVQPGKPVYAGHFVYPQNMKYGHPGFGGIEYGLQQAAFNQIWRKYGIPTYDAGGPSYVLSKNIGYQTGASKMQNLMVSALSGSHEIVIAGALFAELTWAPELAVLDNDICGSVGRFIEGTTVNNDTLALDLIDQVGQIPGTYLDKAHTREWWQKEFYQPKVWDDTPYDLWVERGKKNALDYAHDRVEELLSTYEPAARLTEKQKEGIEEILQEAIDHYQAKDMLTEDEAQQFWNAWNSVYHT